MIAVLHPMVPKLKEGRQNLSTPARFVGALRGWMKRCVEASTVPAPAAINQLTWRGSVVLCVSKTGYGDSIILIFFSWESKIPKRLKNEKKKLMNAETNNL